MELLDSHADPKDGGTTLQNIATYLTNYMVSLPDFLSSSGSGTGSTQLL
jgi:hypothetical protein